MADTQQWVKRDFACDQGSSWRRAVKFWQDVGKTAPVNLTGFQVDMHIREGVADSAAALVKQLSTRVGSSGIRFVAQNLDGTPNLSGTPDPANGWVLLEMSDEETTLLVPSKLPKPKSFPAPALFYYDLELTSGAGETQRRMAGNFSLSLEVTRL